MARDRLDPGTRELELGEGIAGRTGYVWLFPNRDDLDAQVDALRAEGCSRVVVDTGAKRTRLAQVVAESRTLVVCRLCSLGDSPGPLIRALLRLQAEGVELRAIEEGIDTTNKTGRAFVAAVQLLAKAADIDLGRARPKALGRGGRRPVMTSAKQKRAMKLLADGRTVREAAKEIGVSKTVLYSVLAKVRGST